MIDMHRYSIFPETPFQAYRVLLFLVFSVRDFFSIILRLDANMNMYEIYKYMRLFF